MFQYLVWEYILLPISKKESEKRKEDGFSE